VDRDTEFAEYYASRAATMRNTAYLLCGDWHVAEDLTQTAFTKLYLAWCRVSRRDVLDSYTRTVLVRAFLDERRRPWRRERATAPEDEAPGVAGHDTAVAERLALQAALAAVPPRQRAVLVLRFYADLSVEQTAEILSCSIGTVKSQTARGLDRLRAVLDRTPTPTTETPGG
jgi:RNA polymerase sigma-70 factor (sigma-E family)